MRSLLPRQPHHRGAQSSTRCECGSPSHLGCVCVGPFYLHLALLLIPQKKIAANRITTTRLALHSSQLNWFKWNPVRCRLPWQHRRRERPLLRAPRAWRRRFRTGGVPAASKCRSSGGLDRRVLPMIYSIFLMYFTWFSRSSFCFGSFFFRIIPTIKSLVHLVWLTNSRLFFTLS